MPQSIDSCIGRIAGHPTHIGYQYLSKAVHLVLQYGYPTRSLTIFLYPKISEETGATAHNVARAIARAVEDCWEHGSRRELEKVAGRHLPEKPTPGELVYYLVRYLCD